MTKTILEIHGMMCGMCEAHVNDAIRGQFAVKSVRSSHTKNETEILSDAPLDETKLRETIAATGYELKGVRTEEAKRKWFRK